MRAKYIPKAFTVVQNEEDDSYVWRQITLFGEGPSP